MRKIFYLMFLVGFVAVMSGCSGWKWWAAKQMATETGEDVAESMNLTKTKEELREDIADLKKKLRAEKQKVRELEAKCEAGKGDSVPTAPGGMRIPGAGGN